MLIGSSLCTAELYEPFGIIFSNAILCILLWVICLIVILYASSDRIKKKTKLTLVFIVEILSCISFMADCIVWRINNPDPDTVAPWGTDMIYLPGYICLAVFFTVLYIIDLKKLKNPDSSDDEDVKK